MNDITADCVPRLAGSILQFAKAPMPGRVKTRLCPAYSPRQAAGIARMLTEQVAEALSEAPRSWELQLVGDDTRDPFLRRLASAHDRELTAQGAGDLGRRMARAIDTTLRRLPRAIIVGSDCLGYDADYLLAATGYLEAENDAVLGPAQDGGYVLIGFNRFDARVFDGIEWGAANVAATQRARLAALGFRWRELPLRADVDTAADVEALIRAGRLADPRLRR